MPTPATADFRGFHRVGKVDAQSDITNWQSIGADLRDWGAGLVLFANHLSVERRLASKPELFLNDRFARAVLRVDRKSCARIPMGHPHHADVDIGLVIW